MLRDGIPEQEVKVFRSTGADRHNGNRLDYGALRYRPRTFVCKGTCALKDNENLCSRALDHERACREIWNIQRPQAVLRGSLMEGVGHRHNSSAFGRWESRLIKVGRAVLVSA